MSKLRNRYTDLLMWKTTFAKPCEELFVMRKIQNFETLHAALSEKLHVFSPKKILGLQNK